MYNRNQATAQKPEYVLKRANDLIASAVGPNNEKEKRLALEHLHQHIAKGKSKNSQWNKVYESLMKRHLELCVDLKDHRTAKDGLHQYRNLCQSVDPNSLEVVVLHLMEQAEIKATAARKKADAVSLLAAAKISDLDEEETPESIMLSSMTEEGARDRTDREMVVPWLKFLWETYRATLDLLNKSVKLEKTYHLTCHKAFKFCVEYSRALEFRRLCDELRKHLINLQKTPTVNPLRANRVPWEWTPEAVEMHLTTRFAMLEVASTLELWNEGFRTVEDIYAIMQIGKKSPKPKLMANYYEKLTRIFLVSENHLFHAYTSYRYYCLTCDTKKDLKPEDKSIMASVVLLAALCIPSLKDTSADSTSSMTGNVDEDNISYAKDQRMAMLLDFQANPTRHALLSDIVNKGLLNDVVPELAALYTNLELKFHPLTLAKSLVSSVAAVKAIPQLAVYAVPLQRIAVLRVVMQLSRVYSAVKIDFVRSLLAPLSDVSYNHVEKIMVDGVARKQLQLRIDHGAGCLRFGSTVTAGASVENQVAALGTRLGKISLDLTKRTATSESLEAQASARAAYLAKVADVADEEHKTLSERKHIIEQRKEGLERKLQSVADRDRLQLEKEEEVRREQEAQRIKKEADAREAEKAKKLKELVEIKRVKNELEKHGVKMEEDEIEKIDALARAALISDAKATAQKSRDEDSRRVSEQAKRLDHITRALRIEGAEAIGRIYAQQVEQDRVAYEAKLVDLLAEKQKEHAANLVEKARLVRMQAHRGGFEAAIVAKQRADFEAKLENAKIRAINEHRYRRVDNARRLYEDECERIAAEEFAEAERLRKIEDDRREVELQESLKKKREEEEEREREREKAREAEREAQKNAPPPPRFGARGEEGGFGGALPPSGGGGKWQPSRGAEGASRDRYSESEWGGRGGPGPERGGFQRGGDAPLPVRAGGPGFGGESTFGDRRGAPRGGEEAPANNWRGGERAVPPAAPAPARGAAVEGVNNWREEKPVAPRAEAGAPPAAREDNWRGGGGAAGGSGAAAPAERWKPSFARGDNAAPPAEGGGAPAPAAGGDGGKWRPSSARTGAGGALPPPEPRRDGGRDGGRGGGKG